MDITGTLAKLLATENLIVERNAAAHTASFNVETRVLTLPVIENASQEVMTMLAAHEVGHALHTPQDWVVRVINGTPFDFVNVIEDVRIEKYIQDKFPGLKRDFSKGYSEMNDRDFFQIADEDVNKMSLIDRLNLHFKLGHRAVINFTEEEMVWVRAIDECDTFDKVCLTAKELSDWIDERAEKNEEEDDNQEQESEGSGEEQGENDSDQQGEQDQDFGSKGRKGEEPGQEESEEGETSTSEESSTVNEKASSTQNAMNESVKNLNTQNKGTNHVVSKQTGDLGSIVSIETIRDSFRLVERDWGHDVPSEYSQFMLSIKKEVNHMVQRFEMKKSAEAYARATVNKTGVLNTSRLHQYKLTDDIFLRQSVTSDGKSHGMVMFVDWSGSMSGQLVDTVKQLLVLTQFCRKVQIAFKAYAFTTSNNGCERYNEDLTKVGQIANDVVGLYEVIDSTAKKAVLDRDMYHLFSQAMALESRISKGHATNLLYLGGTPLDNALTMVPHIIEEFRQSTGAQKVSFVALTDGQSSPMQYYESHAGMARINYGYNNQNYVSFGNESFKVETPWDVYDTCGIVAALKKVTTDVTFTNIFIGSKGSCEKHMKHNGATFSSSKFTKNSGCASPGLGWDLVSALNVKSFNNSQEDIEIEAGAKKGQIKTALKKFLKSQSTSKVILDSLVDQFA